MHAAAVFLIKAHVFSGFCYVLSYVFEKENILFQQFINLG